MQQTPTLVGGSLQPSLQVNCDGTWKGYAGSVSVFGRPFVKRFVLCYRTVVLSVLCCL